MKVYIVIRNKFRKSEIVGVFKNKKDADKCILNELNKGTTDFFTIEESELI